MPGRILIYVPLERGTTRGNWITAIRWESILETLGHRPTLLGLNEWTPELAASQDALVALHARRSAPVIAQHKETFPERPRIVVLTGTDLHLDLYRSAESQRLVLQSLTAASQIVLLEPAGARMLPAEFQRKVTVIRQSATPVPDPVPPRGDCFEVAIVGHLRDEKDPFLIADAARLLPDSSRIEIVHLGAALTSETETRAIRESLTNDRYQWRGPVSHDVAQRLLARSRLSVLTSVAEGAPSVISESVVNDVPLLATRISAAVGLLGPDYPGLFPVGDAAALAEQLERAEADSDFYQRLQKSTHELQPQFLIDREIESWRILIASLELPGPETN